MEIKQHALNNTLMNNQQVKEEIKKGNQNMHRNK